jgi:hypothetical protein
MAHEAQPGEDIECIGGEAGKTPVVIRRELETGIIADLQIEDGAPEILLKADIFPGEAHIGQIPNPPYGFLRPIAIHDAV